MQKKTNPNSKIKSSPLSNTKKQAFTNKAITDWFTQVTNDMQSDSIQNQIKTSPQMATQMLSRFGLKNPHDLITFLRSPAGKNVQAMINRKLEATKARQNNTADNQLDKQRLHGLAMLLLGLAYTKEAAAEARLHRLNDEAIHKQLEAGEKALEASEKALEESFESLEASAALYHASAEALEAALDEQDEALQALEAEWNEIEQNDAAEATRTDYIENLLFNIEGFLDLDSEEQEQHTQNNPELINRFPKDKTIVNEEGRSYLLARGQKIDALSSVEKEDAHKAYLQLKPDLNNLKKKIKTSHQDEQKQHAKRKQACLSRGECVHQETTFLTQQLTQLQAARHEIQNQLNVNRLKTQEAPEPQLNTAVLTRSFKLMLQLNPQATLAALDRSGAARFLHQTEFGMPIQDQEMRSLQENRAGRAGALANAIARSAITEVSQRQHQRLHPDPEPAATPKAEPQTEQTRSHIPSPFSTTPKPWQ